jgi:lysophospholipase L1-like esterase
VRFKTDAAKILVKHKVTGALAIANMTAIGTSGLDLYNREADGKWYWAGCSIPTANEYTMPILEGASSKEREYMLYLPLYNATESLSIGVPEGFSFEPVEPMNKKPILYYGTSIVQGESTSRPGMSFVAMLGRRLDRPMINFGFAGSGRMEAEMAELIAEMDAEVYVIDCLPNMVAQLIQDRAEIFIRKLRQLRPDTPIVLVEDRTYPNARLIPAREKRHQDSRAAFQGIYDKLTAEGIKGLSYVKGDTILGTDEEGTTDYGSHPNDLGMARMADSLEPVLRKVIDQ